MLFSNDTLANEINERFASAWVNKQPCAKFPPNVRRPSALPLGAGVTNVTAIFATSGGVVLDAVPGYLDVEGFRAEMRFAIDLHARMTEQEEDGRRRLFKPEAGAIYKKAHAELAKVQRGPFVAKAHELLAKAGLVTVEKIGFDYWNELAPRFT